MTNVDKIAAFATIIYLVAIIIFVLLNAWFVFIHTRSLVVIKETRDALEML